MSLRTLTRALPRVSLATSSTRTFATTMQRAAEGSAGAPRSGGAAQGDAFTKREAASEELYVRQQEAEKLKQLKKKIADSEAQLVTDRKEAEELGKKQK